MKIATAPAASAWAPAPSEAFLDLACRSRAELERLLVQGETPDIQAMAGWQYRGMNRPPLTRAVGIRKFIKGFYQSGSQVMGYNVAVERGADDAPWIPRPEPLRPQPFGFYQVCQVDPTSVDNAYLHALLLDYGRGGNPRRDPSRRLRDYVVRVDPGSDHLLLGKAYLAVGNRRLPVSFFFLERLRYGDPPDGVE